MFHGAVEQTITIGAVITGFNTFDSVTSGSSPEMAAWATPSNATTDDGVETTASPTTGTFSQFLRGLDTITKIPSNALYINKITARARLRSINSGGIENLFQIGYVINGSVYTLVVSATTLTTSEVLYTSVFTSSLPSIADWDLTNSGVVIQCSHDSGTNFNPNIACDFLEVRTEYAF
jgi:hypothetical protein